MYTWPSSIRASSAELQSKGINENSRKWRIFSPDLRCVSTLDRSGNSTDVHTFIIRRLCVKELHNTPLQWRHSRKLARLCSRLCRVCRCATSTRDCSILLCSLPGTGRLGKRYQKDVVAQRRSILTMPLSIIRLVTMASPRWKYNSCGLVEGRICCALMYRLFPNVLRLPVTRT